MAKTKALNKKQEKQGLPPLSEETPADLSAVLAEIWRLYRASRDGGMEPEKASKLVYVLREFRETHSAKTLDDIQSKLTELSARVEARRAA